MEIWSRFSTSFSSLPTTSPSSSPPSSSASLDASLLLDFADDLWFYKPLVSLPSLSVPSCLPSFFSSSPDASTLIAQCMITDISPSSQRSLVSSSSSSCLPPPAPVSKLPKPHPSMFLTAYDSLPAPPSIHEIYANTFSEYDEIPYGGGYASSASDRDEDMYRGYTRGGEDEEAYHYYTATSDWDDEDAHHGYHASSDGEDKEQVSAMKVEGPPADTPQRYSHNEPDDAFSGIYVGAALKASKTDWYSLTRTLSKGSRVTRVFFTMESCSLSQ